jgi:hypothetical protein
MRRITALAVLLAGLLAGSVHTALGDSGGPIQCESGDTCTVTVSLPGSPGQGGGMPTAARDASGSGSGGGDPAPSPSGSFFNLPCTYRPDPAYQPPAGADPHPAGSGGWYLMTCPDALKPTGAATWTSTVVWLAAPPPAAALLPDPAQLAAQARSLLRLATPVIESNPRPGLPQMVSVPMWAWIPAGVYAPVSATASVPGEAVTATARPTSVAWSFGDGTSLVCAGPGTPYTAGSDPKAASPTCGHTYTADSGRGTFTVSATVRWTVTWSGAGQSGAFNDMSTTATEAVVVQQSRALVTGG